MLKEQMVFTYSLLTLARASLLLSGCVSRGQGSISEGAAFGVGTLCELGTTKGTGTKDLNMPPPVHGPPQVILRIDGNRYFTLENYTHYESGQTFYDNKTRNIHVRVSDASGYLFKGCLFWLSICDDFLVFPATLNTGHTSCVGSSKGCMNAVIVAIDGGERRGGVSYGSYAQNPTGATRDCDMLVINGGFYLLRYWGGQGRFNPVILRWILSTEDSSDVVRPEDVYKLFHLGEEVLSTGFCRIGLSCLYPKNNVTEMQCDRTLESIQSSENKIQ